MTVTLTTKHREFDITYSEPHSEWQCKALQLAAPQLSTLRAKINAVEAAYRKVARIKVFRIERWDRDSFSHCEITSLVEDEPDYCWITETQGRSRSKQLLNGLVLDTPANRAAFDAYNKAAAEARIVTKAADAILEAIPRVTLADLKTSTTGTTS